MKGYVQIYTGDGKGKTTAALGLIMRAHGAGLRVYLGQFLKNGNYSEIKTLRERFPEVTVKQFGSGNFIKDKPSPEDISLAKQGLDELRQAMLSGKYDVIIADEINCAESTGLLTAEQIIQLIKDKPANIEMILTGRKANSLVIQHANLVTEMKSIRHYHDEGVKARPGIET